MGEFQKRINDYWKERKYTAEYDQMNTDFVLKLIESAKKEFPIKLNQKYRIVEDVKPTSLRGGSYTCEKNGDKQVLTVNSKEALEWFERWFMDSADEVEVAEK